MVCIFERSSKNVHDFVMEQTNFGHVKTKDTDVPETRERSESVDKKQYEGLKTLNGMLTQRLKTFTEDKEHELKELEERLRKELGGQQSQEDTISYTFRWPYGGNEIAVGGEFNNWEKAVAKKEENGDFAVKIDGLKPETKYLYKYVIDGEWKEDATAPTDDSQKVGGRNVINNVLVTGSASKDQRILALEKERDALFRQNQRQNSSDEKLKSIENQLNESKKQVESLKAEKDRAHALEEKVKELTKSNDDAKSKAEEQKKANEKSQQLTQEVEKVKKESAEAQDKLQKKITQLENEKSEAEKKSKAADEATQQLNDLKSRLEKSEAEKAQLKQSSDKAAALEKELEQLKKQGQNQASQLESQLAEKSREVQGQLEASRREAEEQKQLLDRAAGDVHKVTESLQGLQRENGELKNQVDRLQKELAEKSAAQEQGETISYTFRWPYAGNEIAVGGEFNNWEKAVATKEENGEFSVKIDGLKPETKYLYKYVIDGEWKEDITAPTDNSQLVGDKHVTNNVLVTGPASTNDRIAALEKERDALFRQNHKHSQSIRTAHQHHTELDKKFHNVQELLKHQQAEVIRKEEQIAPLRHQVGQLERDVYNAQQKNAELQSALAAAEDRQKQLQETSNAHEAATREALASIRLLHTYIGRLVTVIIQLNSVVRASHPTREEREAAVAEADRELDALLKDKVFKQQQKTLERINERSVGSVEEFQQSEGGLTMNNVPGKWAFGLTVPAVIAAGYILLQRRW
ncbi:viral A-type inclusion protein [Planoprotostelium fungivorum]|uniref:Viral A-type inclusion protein n=1 Tax=Planoprotostelium fungivorum TaxID=1890364 RepID=A0A2P6NXK1_9EUKA|nr:viral A-type inclusion protein [Planoprotostelium fungivorum]